jgi:hypothetical protein
MTLQELHELIGKVLKERPELATAIVETSNSDIIEGIGQYLPDIEKNVISLLSSTSALLTEELAEGEWAWQAN